MHYAAYAPARQLNARNAVQPVQRNTFGSISAHSVYVLALQVEPSSFNWEDHPSRTDVRDVITALNRFGADDQEVLATAIVKDAAEVLCSTLTAFKHVGKETKPLN